MNYKKIFQNVKNEYITDFYVIYLTSNVNGNLFSSDVYTNKDFKKVYDVFKRIVNELKCNRKGDYYIESVQLINLTISSNVRTNYEIINCHRSNDWNCERKFDFLEDQEKIDKI